MSYREREHGCYHLMYMILLYVSMYLPIYMVHIIPCEI